MNDFEPLTVRRGNIDGGLLTDGARVPVGDDRFGTVVEGFDERQEMVVRVAHLEQEALGGEVLVAVEQAVYPLAGTGADFAPEQFEGVARQSVVIVQIGRNQQTVRGGVEPCSAARTERIVLRRLSVRHAVWAAV